jgi:hypothetical protein
MSEASTNNNSIKTTHCSYWALAVTAIVFNTQAIKRHDFINRKLSVEEIDNRLFQHRNTLAFNFQMFFFQQFCALCINSRAQFDETMRARFIMIASK